MAAVTSAVLAGAALAAQTASHFEQKKAARKAERQQDHANRVEKVSAQVRNSTQRRKAVAQARMAQAQNQAGAGGQVQNSSGLAGSNAAIASQAGANIGTQGQNLLSKQASFDLRQSAQDTLQKGQQRAADFGAAAGLFQFGSSALSGVGGVDDKDSPSGSISNEYTGAQFGTWAKNN